MRESDVTCVASSTLDCEVRRIIFTEVAPGIAKAEIVNECRSNDVVEAEQILLSIAINARVSIDIAASTADADRWSFREAEIDFRIVGKAVIKSQRVTSLVLSN